MTLDIKIHSVNAFRLDLELNDIKNHINSKYPNLNVFISESISEIEKHMKLDIKDEIILTYDYDDVLKICCKDNVYSLSDFTHIKNNEIEDININDYDFYTSHLLKEGNYIVVGDIHSELKPLIKLIEKNGDTIVNGIIKSDNNNIYIVQDYVDKGNDVLSVIEFIYNNFKNGRIIPLLGNHENFIYKSLVGYKGFKSDWIDDEDRFKFLNRHFQTYFVLSHPSSLRYKEMFIELVENSKNWYKTEHFFINHSPCKSKYIGKIDNASLRKQRALQYNCKDDNELFILLDSIKSTYDNLDLNYFLVWGHIALNNVYKNDIFVMIDSGSVYGNKLSCINQVGDIIFVDNEKTLFN